MSVISKAEIQINRKALKSFQHISVNQNLYGIDRFEITCRYDALEKADAFLIENSKEFLGAPILIQTKIDVKGEEKDGITFRGYVTGIQSTRSGMADYDQVVISGGSSEIALNRKPTNRAFLDKTLEEIVEEVLKPYPLKSQISTRNKLRFPYMVQFEESDLEFLKRLSIRYGEWFFFTGQELVFGEMPVVEKSLTIGSDLTDFRYELRVNPVKFSLFSVDPLKLDVYNYQSGNSKTETNLDLYGRYALDRSKQLYTEEGRDYYEHLNVDETQYQQGLDNVGETEELSDAVNLADISGSSVAGFLSAGMQIKINCLVRDGKSRTDYGKYLVTSVQHSIENTLNYRNHFAAIPAQLTIPENTDPYYVKHTYHQLGKVADNVDPKKLGRVKISFWWMEDRQMTPWVKVVTPYSHQSAGFYFVPAINSRVLVGFEDGDVEKPYCIGTLFDEENSPDSAWAGNYDKSNAKIHAIRTQSGQTIEFYDESGKEKIRIYDTNGKNEITLDSANGEINIKAKSKLVIESGDKLNIQARDIVIKADSGLKIEAGQALEQKGMDIKSEASSGFEMKGTNVEISANASLKAEGSASAEISSSGITTVKGSMVKIN
ncbi:MAG: hypothetical protein JXR61_07220 [Prolixibacteraceae bacterium]|nr:hypothetical protein [Bacteroidales bacterium]MBN2636043.1 hypothetical protein [Prolixibacteraceae bacterium]